MQKDDKKDSKVLDRLKFHDSFSFWESEQQEEYNQFITQMSFAFQENAFSWLIDENPVEYLIKVSDFMCERERDVRQEKKFLENIDIEKLVKGLEKATANQVSDCRRGILHVYDIANIRSFLPDDKEALVELKVAVQKLIDENKGKDKVVRLQYMWLSENIKKVVDNY